MEPDETRRGCLWPFVPFLGKKSCLGRSRILDVASQISTNDNLLRMPQHNSSVLVRNKCPPPSTVMSISIKKTICARSVGPFGRPEEKKGSNTCSSSSWKTAFLWLHGICSMSATNQHQLIWQIMFHSVCSSALWRGVKTLPTRLLGQQ